MSDVLTPDATETAAGGTVEESAGITAATDTAGDTQTPICACGATQRHAADADRCVRGHVLVGNQTRRVHGVRAFETTGRLPDVLRQTVEEFRDAVIADRGGPSELSTLEVAYIRRLSEIEAVTRLLAADLASRGLTTPRGRVRGTYPRWLESLDRWDRFAQRVGTGRRSRTMALHDYVTQPQPSETEDARVRAA